MDTTVQIGENVRKKPKRIGEKVRKKPKDSPFLILPDDMIPNILSRLPAKNVVQCRLVCRKWRDLTLGRDFVDLHCRNSLPMILVSNPKDENRCSISVNYDFVEYFFLDKWWELPVRKKLMIHKFNRDYGYDLVISHDGLVVFKNYYPGGGCRFFVANPIDIDNVRIISLSKEIRWSEIYGVFFHPLRKEYCSLWMIQELTEPWRKQSHPKWIKYKVLSLGSNPSMKTISNQFSHRIKKQRSSPLFIHKYLYWMLEPENDIISHSDIMQFDFIREEFKVLPCPVPLDDKKLSYNKTYLLNIDGTLSFLLILPRKITIWKLDDHARQLWTTATYNFTIELYQNDLVPKAIAVVDGKLALLSDGRLAVCNLKQGTMYCRKTPYYVLVSFWSHQMSIASLTNCTSQIFIDQEGEVAQIVSGGTSETSNSSSGWPPSQRRWGRW